MIWNEGTQALIIIKFIILQVNTEPKINLALFLEITGPEVIKERMYSVQNTINLNREYFISRNYTFSK